MNLQQRTQRQNSYIQGSLSICYICVHVLCCVLHATDLTVDKLYVYRCSQLYCVGILNLMLHLKVHMLVYCMHEEHIAVVLVSLYVLLHYVFTCHKPLFLLYWCIGLSEAGSAK